MLPSILLLFKTIYLAKISIPKAFYLPLFFSEIIGGMKSQSLKPLKMTHQYVKALKWSKKFLLYILSYGFFFCLSPHQRLFEVHFSELLTASEHKSCKIVDWKCHSPLAGLIILCHLEANCWRKVRGECSLSPASLGFQQQHVLSCGGKIFWWFVKMWKAPGAGICGC